MAKARIILADDHALLTEGIQKLLQSDFNLVGTAGDGRALLTLVRDAQPDLALVDISLPLLNGIEAIRQIRKISPNLKVIFLTMHDEPTFVEEALRVGANGYVLKDSAITELKRAIQEVLENRIYITPSLAQDFVIAEKRIRKRPHNPSLDKLTARQREILQLIAEGRSNKDIANTLNIALKTVEFHKTRIMRELGIRTTAELTKYAIAQGLVNLDIDPPC